MKTEAEFGETERVDVTITITATLYEWRQVKKELNDVAVRGDVFNAAWGLHSQIVSVLNVADGKLYPEKTK